MNDVTKKYIRDIILAKRNQLQDVEEGIERVEKSLAARKSERDELRKEITTLEADLI